MHALADLENADDFGLLDGDHVLWELTLLAQRQFEWQRGFSAASQLYRAAVLYGGPETTSLMHNRYGFAAEPLIRCGFALRAATLHYPSVLSNISLNAVGIGAEQRDAILARISSPYRDVREIASALRTSPMRTAYKRSVLRQFPLIAFGKAQEASQLVIPLRELVSYRTTVGIFYDVVVGSHDRVRNEVAKAFESYCYRLLNLFIKGVHGEQSYRVGKNTFLSPDLSIKLEDETFILLAECKATRMNLEARYGDDHLASAHAMLDLLRCHAQERADFLVPVQDIRGLKTRHGEASPRKSRATGQPGAVKGSSVFRGLRELARHEKAAPRNPEKRLSSLFVRALAQVKRCSSEQSMRTAGLAMGYQRLGA